MNRAELARLFEGAPSFVERLVAAGSTDPLAHAEEIALAMPGSEQIELLNAHPRIGAAPASVSVLSHREQGYDRDSGTAELQARLDRLNDEYERRFGFRFVILVAGRSRAEIADILQAQLGADREEEKRRGLHDVVAIARDRAARLAPGHEPPTVAPEIAAHYERGQERDRLNAGAGRLELLRTQQVLRRWLPKPPARVVDVGGGAGAHATRLAAEGYDVLLVDPLAVHVEMARQASAAQPGHEFRAEVADARDLPLASDSIDVALLLGPLYHLTERADRLAALAEARRVLVPGGYLAAAAISRFADWLDGIARDLFGREGFQDMSEASAASGRHNPPNDEWFTTSYFHRPYELVEECRQAGFEVSEPVAVEGIGFLIGDLDDRLSDETRRERLLTALEFLETEPSIVGASPHLLALARKPAE